MITKMQWQYNDNHDNNDNNDDDDDDYDADDGKGIPDMPSD